MIRLFRFLKPYAIPITAVAILVIIQAMTQLYLPTLMADIVNIGIINGYIDYILKTGVFMLLVASCGGVCAVTASFLSSQIAMGFGRTLRAEIFTHVSEFSLHEFDKLGTPSLIIRNTNDVTQVQMALLIMIRMMILAPITCVGAIVMALSKDRELWWVIAVMVPVLAASVSMIASKAFPLFQAIQAKIDRINLVLREGLTGIRVIRAFNRVDHERTRFQDANLDLTETSIKVNRFMAFVMPLTMLIMNLTSVAIIWFGSIRIEHGTSNVGNLMAFLQYAMQIMFSLFMATMMLIMLPRAQASAGRINEVLATMPEIDDPPLPIRPGALKGYLEFKDVSFRYHGAQEAALKRISFSALPGEVTAIIGSTGSGKSTLVNLIPRFYDVESGGIEIDGVDIREMSQEVLRAKIGFVPQVALLFSGTIAENIRFGKQDATDAEVEHAAEVAQAEEFIRDMDGGFDAPIAQGGTNISGGQKQRLSIARALVGRPEIYVFDDSFSALDFKTDARLRAMLRKETKDSAVLIVAQRVATIMNADRIIVLDDGRMVGIGTHEELYDTCEVYREIVASQLSEEELG